MNSKTPQSIISIRSVDELITEIGAGAKFKYLYFWGHTGKGIGPHILSQWYPAEFHEKGVLFKSAEHYMMYKKALLFSDLETAKSILAADDPGKVKALGRQIKNFEDSKWMLNRFDIVVEGSVLKFGSDPSLLAFLLNSNPRVLVEASPRDKIWGIGLDAKNELAENPFKWKGQNLLGFALMEARGKLLASAA